MGARKTISRISFCFGVIGTALKWFKKATSKDGDGGKKVTPSEIAELMEDLSMYVMEAFDVFD